MLILASRSAARAAMLTAAGVPFEAMPAGVDEESAKLALREQGVDARALADALAELKAQKLSMRHAGALVLGSDQVVALDDGTTLDKPSDRDEAAAQLRRLRGTTHRLISAAVLCEAGRPVWRHVEVVRLAMRDFSDAFLEGYLDAEWPAIAGCAGSYRYEGLGAQLFTQVSGSHFAVLGMPLLPLLDYLRLRGLLLS